MYMLIGPRACGKTYSLLNALAEDPKLCLFVSSYAEAERVKKLVQVHYRGRIDPKRILVLGRDKLEGTNKVALVDNVDLYLEGVVGGRVVGGSCTGFASKTLNPHLTNKCKEMFEAREEPDHEG